MVASLVGPASASRSNSPSCVRNRGTPVSSSSEDAAAQARVLYLVARPDENRVPIEADQLVQHDG